MFDMESARVDAGITAGLLMGGAWLAAFIIARWSDQLARRRQIRAALMAALAAYAYPAVYGERTQERDKLEAARDALQLAGYRP